MVYNIMYNAMQSKLNSLWMAEGEEKWDTRSWGKYFGGIPPIKPGHNYRFKIHKLSGLAADSDQLLLIFRSNKREWLESEENLTPGHSIHCQ